MDIQEFAAIDTSDNASMLPDGGLTDEDIIDNPEFTDEEFERFFSADDEDHSDDSAEETTPPTTEDKSAAAEQEESNAAPTTEQSNENTSSKIKVKVKIDHEEQDIEIDHDDLPGIYQRANNYDRLYKKFSEKEAEVQGLTALAKQLGFDSVKAMVEHAANNDRDERIQALVDEGTSREVAEDYVDRKLEKERSAAKPMATEEQQETKKESNYKNQVDEFFRARPDLKGMKKLPSEVVKAVITENIPLRTAYAEWEARQAKAEQDRLKQENERIAQTAEAASRAPVRGTKTENTDKGKDDPWLSAFRNAKY